MVTVAVAASDGGVTVKIGDTGIGIAAKDLNHVFDRFYRCDPSRSEPGSGLGLSLAKAFVNAHGGEIVVTTCPGGRHGGHRNSSQPVA